MRRVNADDGNVIVEFIGITVALLVPLSIIASSSIMVANAYLATDVSARTAARAFVISNSAAGLLAQDFDSHNAAITTKITCSKNPCLSPGGFVTVRVSKEVRLNLPRAFGSRSVVVASQHTAIVDELRSP
jgi:hypothetical protein